MSKEARLVFENRLKQKIGEKFAGFQEETILEMVADCLDGFNIEMGVIEAYDSEDLLKNYLNALDIQGRSPKTLNVYEYQIRRLMKWVEIPVQDLTVFHLRAYLNNEKERGLSNETLEGIRQVLSAYFNWLHREGLILRNPTANLGAIKRQKKVKTTYSEIDIEKLKTHCKTLRDKAIVCFLYSTGCRISEALSLNRNDVDINSLECTVLGKGNKERTVYLDGVSAMVLSEYLDQRTDNEEALFVGTNFPHARMQPGGVRAMLHELEEETGVEHVHPHKFRRTRATRLVKHGMPIQEVAAVLGHEKLDTTMKYVVMDKSDIKNAYQKYV